MTESTPPAGDPWCPFPADRELLTGLSSRIERLMDMLIEVKSELSAVGHVGQQTLAQATKTNGRVSELEQWHGEVLTAAAVSAGQRKMLTAAIRHGKLPFLALLGGVGFAGIARAIQAVWQ